MGWEVNDEEFASVLTLPGRARYEYFIKRAASHGQLWSLRDDDGWVIAEDDDGNQHLPVWPHQRFAQACASGPWSGDKPVPLDVDEWVAGWLPDLEEDGIRVAVFQTPDDHGVGVAPKRLKMDLEAELAKFEFDH